MHNYLIEFDILTMLDKFDTIRPYDDADLNTVLPRFYNNKPFINSIVKFRFSSWPRFIHPFLAFFTRRYILRKTSNLKTLRAFQDLFEPYIERMLKKTTHSFTVSGMDALDLSQPCLFISNHRDIAIDPALVNWALHINGQDTVRIAVGDNLLKKEWVADIIRLNKCFIVKRSAKERREKLAAAKLLSEYIEYSLNTERQHVWIAQREGRAKDGNDVTNPAIVSMLSLNKPKTQSFADYIKHLHVVPVTISYEFDPCDIAKAKERQQIEKTGHYSKPENEDVNSIVSGITGQKGRVHLHFGDVLTEHMDDAKQVSNYVDRAILKGYRPFATGLVAAQRLHSEFANAATEESREHLAAAASYLNDRVKNLSKEEGEKLLGMYAQPYLNIHNSSVTSLPN